MGQPLHRSAKWLISLSVAAAVWFPFTPSAAVPAQAADGSPATSVRTGFPDVPAAHWAGKYISRLAAQGIIQGDDRGNYNPSQSVTREQVLIMAVRMMGLEAEALRINPETYILPGISGFAKPYVIEADASKLINFAEETGSSGKPDLSWGTRPATREWVCRIAVRILGQDIEEVNDGISADFADVGSISPSDKRYVELAASLGIVDGFEDGTFRPKDLVTRAQMAAFFVRSAEAGGLLTDRMIYGTVRSIADDSMSLTDYDGLEHEFSIGRNTVFYTYKNGDRIAFNDIKPNSDVSVVYDGRTAIYIEMMNEAPTYDTVEGELIQADPVSMTLTLSIDGTARSFPLTQTPIVTDGDGKGSGLSSLEKGSLIEIRRNNGESAYARVTLLAPPEIVKASGILVQVDMDNRLMTVADGVGGLTVNAFDTNMLADMRLLGPGEIVSYELRNWIVDDIRAIEPDGKNFDAGTIKNVDLSALPDNRILTLTRPDNSLGSYAIDEDVAVIKDGIEVTAEQLKPGASIAAAVNPETHKAAVILILH